MNRLALIVMLAWIAPSLPTPAQSAHPETAETIARRVLELRREADRILDQLPPDLRREVEARIEALREAPASVKSSEESTTLPPPGPTAPVDRSALDRGPSRCRALEPFDGNGDGWLDGADRAWRHFYLWRDDGDDRLDPGEVVSLYEVGVRGLDTGLRSARMRGDRTGSLDAGGSITLDAPVGKRRSERGVVTVDADGLARAGGPIPVGSSGEPITGFVPLTRDLRLRLADAAIRPLLCERR